MRLGGSICCDGGDGENGCKVFDENFTSSEILPKWGILGNITFLSYFTNKFMHIFVV